MNFSAFALLFLLPCLGACTAAGRVCAPALSPIADETLGHRCASVFPEGRWQFVHSIDFSMQNGAGSTVIGVTSLADGEISCALMSIEGFTLFEATSREGQPPEVRRAVPPFDKPAFAAGLMNDVRLIFLAPSADQVAYGQLADHTPVCRYLWAEGRLTDVLPAGDGGWRINTFTRQQDADRALLGRSCRRIGDALVPEYLELTGFGQAGYTLKLTLIRAEKLN